MTTATSTTIPDFSSAGLGLPASATYTWGFLAFAPYADMNAATGPDGYYLAASNYGRDGSMAETSTRSFTTAP
ncbi:MAG: hypothetical protein L0Y66_08495 [Myxococcaceae bacterium]|nr:hypothetical protein [Myxococcaceae bacterium]MCI0672809.1 hypothetical protein [Myxococcaceae bacterium]